MADRAKESMRTDRRLLDRPGWISKDELDRELAALPDVTGKIDPQEDDPSGEEAELSGSGSSSPLSGGDFSPPGSDEPGGGFSPSN